MRLASTFFFSVCFSLLILTGCDIGIGDGLQQQVASRPLSLNDPLLRTCVFDPGHSIVHFPMYHIPPQSGVVSNEDFERVVKSQFQLLHTLLDYNRSYQKPALFEETVISDGFDKSYINKMKRNLVERDTLRRLDGTQLFVANERRRAFQLFQGGFPAFYEQMNADQKRFLWDLGASWTLYFLEEIPRLYRVIDSNQFNFVRTQLGGNFSGASIQQNAYWIYSYREQRLREQVEIFRSQNPGWTGLIFIAYGKNHDFSDDFAGYPFQSGHSFCLGWDSPRLAGG